MGSKLSTDKWNKNLDKNSNYNSPFEHKTSSSSFNIDTSIYISSQSTSKIFLSTQGGSLFKDIRKYYRFREVLGGGHFGTVRVAYKIGVVPVKFFAVKSIPKKNFTEKNLSKLLKEVEIMSNLQHPNIIQLFETYHDKLYFHIVMELCEGKDLYEKIKEEGFIKEPNAIKYMFQLLNAISYCHFKGICHRDLKPENILLETREEEGEIKLIDFGSSRVYPPIEKMHSLAGTPYYISPQVLAGHYDEKCDIWSIGAITFTMLCGEPPFYGENKNEIFQKIIKEELIFRNEKWKNISPDAIDFIKKCMVRNPADRLSAIQALNHPWFQHHVKQKHILDYIPGDIIENLIRYEEKHVLKRLTLRYFIHFLNEDDLKRFRRAFYAINLDLTGSIKIEELYKAFKLYDVTVTFDILTNIFELADEKNEGSLDYCEFILRSLDSKMYNCREKLLHAFEYFDIDNDGEISSSDLKNSMLRIGKDCIDNDNVYEIIVGIGENRKVITRKEFLKLFNCEE